MRKERKRRTGADRSSFSPVVDAVDSAAGESEELSYGPSASLVAAVVSSDTAEVIDLPERRTRAPRPERAPAPEPPQSTPDPLEPVDEATPLPARRLTSALPWSVEQSFKFDVEDFIARLSRAAGTKISYAQLQHMLWELLFQEEERIARALADAGLKRPSNNDRAAQDRFIEEGTLLLRQVLKKISRHPPPPKEADE